MPASLGVDTVDAKELGELIADMRHVREDVAEVKQQIKSVNESVNEKIDALTERVNNINLALSTEQVAIRQKVQSLSITMSTVVSGIITFLGNALASWLRR